MNRERDDPVPEARLENGVPVSAGWFVVNARDAHWRHNRMRSWCRFSGEGEAHFDEVGLGMFWLEPEQVMSLYHHEAGQKDFLVLSGEPMLIIEGEERPLQPWDFVHCPPRTAHTIVATGETPVLIFAVGARRERGSARYPVEPVAIARGAGVPNADVSATERYASFGAMEPGPAPRFFWPEGGQPVGPT